MAKPKLTRNAIGTYRLTYGGHVTTWSLPGLLKLQALLNDEFGLHSDEPELVDELRRDGDLCRNEGYD